MGEKSALFSKHNDSFAIQIMMWDVVGWVLFGFFVSLVGFFLNTIFTFLQSSDYHSSNNKETPTWKEGTAYFYCFGQAIHEV